MSVRRAVIEEKREQINALARQHRARSIALFGSIARGHDTASSDADFLVEFEDGSSLFDLMHLADDLQELLGFEVDDVSVGGLKSRDEHIRRDAVPL